MILFYLTYISNFYNNISVRIRNIILATSEKRKTQVCHMLFHFNLSLNSTRTAERWVQALPHCRRNGSLILKCLLQRLELLIILVSVHCCSSRLGPVLEKYLDNWKTQAQSMLTIPPRTSSPNILSRKRIADMMYTVSDKPTKNPQKLWISIILNYEHWLYPVSLEIT